MRDIQFHGIGVGKKGVDLRFGDGSDGAFPVVYNPTITAPSGGTADNLMDGDENTVLTSASGNPTRTIAHVDFGVSQEVESVSLKRTYCNTGAATIQIQYSFDNSAWNDYGTAISINTTATLYTRTAGEKISARYWRILHTATSSRSISIGELVPNEYLITVPETGLITKQYTSFILETGKFLSSFDPCAGLIIFCQGNITINGKIDMSQKAGRGSGQILLPGIGIVSVAGGIGGNGGAALSGSDGTAGTGGAGTTRINAGGFGGGGGGAPLTGIGSSGFHGGNGGDGGQGFGNVNPPRHQGSLTLNLAGAHGVHGAGGGGAGNITSENGQPTRGGASFGGGGGGGSSKTVGGLSGGNGQYSGGFIVLVAGGNITINGEILCNGGTGGNGGSTGGSGNERPGGGGGGAGGGVIVIYHKGTYTNNGIIYVNGGAGGTGGSPSGNSGSSGGVGSISINQLA